MKKSLLSTLFLSIFITPFALADVVDVPVVYNGNTTYVSMKYEVVVIDGTNAINLTGTLSPIAPCIAASTQGFLEIPEDISVGGQDYPVRSIDQYAFYNCTKLTGIKLPRGLQSIGDNAFSKCSALTFVTNPDMTHTDGVVISDRVSSLGFDAFSQCSSIKSFELESGSSITTLPGNILAYCSQLQTVTAPTITNVGASAFYQCSSLQSVTLSDNLLSIGRNAFGYTKIPSFVIPDGITSISQNAFANNDNLQSITIGNGVTTIEDYAFANCSSLTTLTLGDNVSTIGEEAFSGIGIREITFPSTTSNISTDAFKNCTSLRTITFENCFPIMQSTAFSGISATRSDVTLICEAAAYKYFNDHAATTGFTIKPVLKLPSGWTAYYTLTDFSLPDNIDAWVVTRIGRDKKEVGISKVTTIKGGQGVLLYCDTDGEYTLSPISITTEQAEKYNGNMLTGVTRLWNFGQDLSRNNIAFTLEGDQFERTSSSKSIPAYTSYLQLLASQENDVEDVLTLHYIGDYTLEYELETIDGLAATTPTVETVKSGTFAYAAETGDDYTNDAVATANDLNRDGWTFSGWDRTAPTLMPDTDIVIKGTITRNKYNVTYSATHPDDTPFSHTDEVYYEGSVPTPPAMTEYEGYTFEGWEDTLSTLDVANDVNIAGQYTINHYDVTFQAPDADGGFSETTNYAYQETITVPAGPAKTGYTFTNWDTNLPADGKVPANDLTISAEYRINKYAIIYEIDGVETHRDSITYNTDPGDINGDTIKTGYTFSSWSDVLPATMPAHDITLTGSFTINQYTITYYVNGEVYHTDTQDYDSDITLPTDPDVTGNTFSAWSWNPESIATTMKVPAGDITATARFGVNNYIITYIIDGAVYTTQNYDFEDAVTAPAVADREGYTFTGWLEGVPATMPAADVTLTARYDINRYRVIYVVEGRDGGSILWLNYGEKVPEGTTEIREGYTFYWDGKPATMPAQNITVTGRFRPNKYLVTYQIDGETLSTDSVEYATTITPPNAPAKDGYTFAWGDIPESMPAEDIVVSGTYTAASTIKATRETTDGLVDVYNITGRQILSQVRWADVVGTLPKGVYIVGGKKAVVR